MTDIRVNPVSITGYGSAAQDQFNGVITQLKSLCNACVEVRFYGANSVQFKNGAGDLAESFANGLRNDMGNVANAIRTATSNIAGSLGGAPITIEVSGEAIAAPPAPADTGESGANTEALEGLITTVGTHFTAITSLLDNHLTSLQNTDWTGNAKENSVGAVTQFTTMAKDKASKAQEGLVNYIRSQIDAVVAADV